MTIYYVLSNMGTGIVCLTLALLLRRVVNTGIINSAASFIWGMFFICQGSAHIMRAFTHTGTPNSTMVIFDIVTFVCAIPTVYGLSILALKIQGGVEDCEPLKVSHYSLIPRKSRAAIRMRLDLEEARDDVRNARDQF